MKSTAVRLAAAAVVLFLAGLPAGQAQEATRVYRIGFVGSGSATPSLDAFRQALRELGYVEGKNIIVEARFAEARSERLPRTDRRGNRQEGRCAVGRLNSRCARREEGDHNCPYRVREPIRSGRCGHRGEPRSARAATSPAPRSELVVRAWPGVGRAAQGSCPRGVACRGALELGESAGAASGAGNRGSGANIQLESFCARRGERLEPGSGTCENRHEWRSSAYCNERSILYRQSRHSCSIRPREECLPARSSFRWVSPMPAA